MRTDKWTLGPILPTLQLFMLFYMVRHALHYHYACLVDHTTIHGQSRNSLLYGARDSVIFEDDTALLNKGELIVDTYVSIAQ
jgi:hypothetical protein